MQQTDHPHAARLKAGIEAFNRRDHGSVKNMFTDDATIHVVGKSPLAGEHRGIDAVSKYFSRIHESTDSHEIKVKHVVADDNYAVAFVEIHGRANGQDVRNPEVYVFRVKDGKANEAWYCSSEDYDVDAAWRK